ncbi:hypothetical protein [Phenylobacterium sp.]
MKPPTKDRTKPAEAADREAKLAQALRANLRRRKAPKGAEAGKAGQSDPD